MKLIAKRPCSFCGKQFYAGDEVPAEYVLDPVRQERWGVLELTQEEPSAPAPKKAPAKKGGKKPVEEAGEQ